MLWNEGQRLGLFEWYKRVGGAAGTTFSLSAMLLEHFNISYSGSDAFSIACFAFVVVPAHCNGNCHRWKCLREGTE